METIILNLFTRKVRTLCIKTPTLGQLIKHAKFTSIHKNYVAYMFNGATVYVCTNHHAYLQLKETAKAFARTL